MKNDVKNIILVKVEYSTIDIIFK